MTLKTSAISVMRSSSCRFCLRKTPWPHFPIGPPAKRRVRRKESPRCRQRHQSWPKEGLETGWFRYYGREAFKVKYDDAISFGNPWGPFNILYLWSGNNVRGSRSSRVWRPVITSYIPPVATTSSAGMKGTGRMCCGGRSSAVCRKYSLFLKSLVKCTNEVQQMEVQNGGPCWGRQWAFKFRTTIAKPPKAWLVGFRFCCKPWQKLRSRGRYWGHSSVTSSGGGC